MHVLMMPKYYLKMIVIIKKRENVNEYHAGFDDAKKGYLMSMN